MATQKSNRLAAAFSKSVQEPATQSTTKVSKSISRVGKKTVIAYIDPAGAREFKLLAIDADRSQQDMLTEAINDFLVKHGKKPLA